MQNEKIYVLMCKDTQVLEIYKDSGKLIIFNPRLIPVGLNLKDSEFPLYNIQEFDQWCANRILPLSRKNVKKICNALGISQDQSVSTKAAISRAYHCCTLTDSYWVRLKDSTKVWGEVSLFANKSSNILTPVSLCGKASSIFNRPLNHADMVVDGTFAKSWVRCEDAYHLLKADDNTDARKVHSEVLASHVISGFTDNVVLYEEDMYDDTTVSKCKCFTDEDNAYVPFKALEKANGHGSALRYALGTFPKEFAMMAIMAYLTGNEDLHSGNWGFIQDMNTGIFTEFAPLFDFNYCFSEDYAESSGLPFLPETKIVDVETGNEIAVDELDEYEFNIVHGRTLEEAAIYYGQKYLQSFTAPDISSVPDEFRTELSRRIAVIEQAINRDNDDDGMPPRVNSF